MMCTKPVVQRCSKKKVLLQISQHSQENNCAKVSFLKKRLWHMFFPVNFVKFQHLWWLLLCVSLWSQLEVTIVRFKFFHVDTIWVFWYIIRFRLLINNSNMDKNNIWKVIQITICFCDVSPKICSMKTASFSLDYWLLVN